MSDTFHYYFTYENLCDLFYVITNCNWNIFQILTKRTKIMSYWLGLNHLPDNVWLGITVENESAKHRIEVLRRSVAKVKFISFEPLLSSVGILDLTGIDWVIVGGESGVGRRPMNPQWATEIHCQCFEQSVPFFFKGHGLGRNTTNNRLLYGKEWNEFPKVKP
jgi:protein gp37